MTPQHNGLRIALVSAFPPGHQSLNEYGYHLAKGLAARDDVAEVVVVADKLGAPLPELDMGPKVTVRRVWTFNAPLSTFHIARAIRKARVDGAVFNLQTASFGDSEVSAALGLMAPLATRLSGTPAGVIAHNLIGGIDLEETQLKGQKLRQAIVRLGGAAVTRALVSANYLTVTLESYRDMLARSYPKARVALVPHGTFDSEKRAFVPAQKRPMRLVTMGKFGTYKRLDTLLAAVDLVRQRPGLEHLELIVGGSDHPNAKGYMAKLAEARRNDPGVRFQGYVAEDDIPGFFEQARASVFDYSATTGSSGVLHQTACYGAVPVFPHIGDFVDVARDEGLQGANYAPNDAADMADAIQRVLENTDWADDLAQSNMAAAQGMPFSEVVAYHVRQFASVAGATGKPRDETAAVPLA